MRYALIIAGGSGTRLWPMSRAGLPKQLIPFIGGKSLLEIAWGRFEGMLPLAQRYICAGETHRGAIFAGVPGLGPEQFLGEPLGRDTLVAVGFSAAVLAAGDPDAVVGVFTADHLIEPVAEFQRIIDQGFQLVERHPHTLVTFGIAPTHAATGYGYLELGEVVEGDRGGKSAPENAARIVRQFREKPPLATAEEYVKQGSEHYLWNSGMFVWRAATLLDCIRRYQPDVYQGLSAVAAAWRTPRRKEVLDRVYPTLKKTSVDYGVMEPASRDAAVRVAAIPMPLTWLDVGSWPAFAATCPHDEQRNALAAKSIVSDSSGCLLASSDPQHLIATIGCRDLIVIHTPDATLVCPADRAEQIKQLQKEVESRFGPQYG